MGSKRVTGADLEFISWIHRDGLGVTSMEGKETWPLEAQGFVLNRLSIREDTYIASGFHSYVVRLKKAEALHIEDRDLMVLDMKDHRVVMVAARMFNEENVRPASERDRVTWYRPRGSSEYKVVDELPRFEPEP